MLPCRSYSVLVCRSNWSLRCRKGAPVRRLILLAVVALIGIGSVVPRLHAEGEQTIAVQAGGQMVLADFTTTAAETFTTVTSVSLWDGQAWSLIYRPSTGSTDFPIKPGNWLWIVSPRAQTITIAAPPPPPQVSDPKSCDFADATTAVFASTFQVITSQGSGTAFYIGDDEWLTAAHVVDSGGRIQLRTRTQRLTATLVGLDAPSDLALLRASGSDLTALEFADFDALRPGQTLGVAGFPGAAEDFASQPGHPSVSSGVLSRVVERESVTYIQTNAEVNPGNSGGPLFTACGAIVGVISQKYERYNDRPVEGIGYAVALPTIDEKLPHLRAGQIDTATPAVLVTDQDFGVTAICNMPWDETIGAYVPYETSEDCHDGGLAGIDPAERWDTWGYVLDWDNVWWRFDGSGEAISNSEFDAAFGQLSLGLHTAQIIEWLPETKEWTDWSEPYTFTITR